MDSAGRTIMASFETDANTVSIPDDAVQDCQSSIQQRLPAEVMNEILAAFLRVAEPVGIYAKPCTFYRALAPFNCNHETRAEAETKMASYSRFVGTLKVHHLCDPSLYDFIFPMPAAFLPTVRHMELRISLGCLMQTKDERPTLFSFTPAQIVEASILRHDVRGFVK